MRTFLHRGIEFEDHGWWCDCESCRKSNWDAANLAQGALVLMQNNHHGWYHTYGGTFNRQQAADWILAKKRLGLS